MEKQDNQYMRRALELASRGMGNVAPNPLVGCVIVKDDKIVGEGWHKKYGKSHAEVNAVESITDSELLNNATVYINLGPVHILVILPPVRICWPSCPSKELCFLQLIQILK